VLVVVSGIAALTCYFSLAGIPSLVMGIIALTKNNTDPEGARRLARIGWITFGVISAVIILIIVAIIVIAIASSDSTYSSTYSTTP
jgi:hypothetical protein